MFSLWRRRNKARLYEIARDDTICQQCLPSFCQYFVSMLQQFWRCSDIMLLYCSQCVGINLAMFWHHCGNACATFWHKLGNVLAMCQQCDGIIVAMFCNHFSNILTILQQYFGIDSTILWQCFCTMSGHSFGNVLASCCKQLVKQSKANHCSTWSLVSEFRKIICSSLVFVFVEILSRTHYEATKTQSTLSRTHSKAAIFCYAV